MFFMKKMPAHPPKFPPGFCAICTPPGQNIALPQFCAGHGAGDSSLFWWDLPAGPGGRRAALPENAPCAGCGRSLEQEALLFFSCPCYTSRTGGGDSLRPVQKKSSIRMQSSRRAGRIQDERTCWTRHAAARQHAGPAPCPKTIFGPSSAAARPLFCRGRLPGPAATDDQGSVTSYGATQAR